ncbi:hypothetical protein ACFLWX_01150 [Chloroflexota bacterium]
METKEKIVVENPLKVAGLSIIPVVRISVNCACLNKGISLFGKKEPAAIIIKYSEVKRAFRPTGEEILLEDFRQEFPGIDI